MFQVELRNIKGGEMFENNKMEENTFFGKSRIKNRKTKGKKLIENLVNMLTSMPTLYIQ